jgi:hypothetical protein
MKYTVIFRMSGPVYILTLDKSELLERLNGRIFQDMRVLEEFPPDFQNSYGARVDDHHWPENCLLILKQGSIVVPTITKKLTYYSLGD